MLSGDVITKLGDLWFRGPAGYPDIMAIIPQDLRERAKLWAQDVEGAPLTDSRLSLRHGLDVIKDYMELSHRFRPFIFSSFVGSYDVVAAGNKVMHQQLKDMGERFVLEDLTLVSVGSSLRKAYSNHSRLKVYSTATWDCLYLKRDSYGGVLERFCWRRTYMDPSSIS